MLFKCYQNAIFKIANQEVNKERFWTTNIIFCTEELFYCVYFKVQPDLGILLLVEYQSQVFYFRNELSWILRVVEIMNKYLNVEM